MARARNLKPGFFSNESLAECTLAARLCFAGLWTLGDREGRLEDRPKRIKGQLFAYDSFEVEPLLRELHDRGFILRYKFGEQALIQIIKFSKHQNPHHREAPSTLPAPPGWAPEGSEPEAQEPSQQVKAQGEPEASPGLSGHESAKQGGKAVLNPSSLNPSSLNPSVPAEDRPADGAAAPAPAKKRAAPERPGKTIATWVAYAEAYRRRHGADPIRGKAINGQLSRFVDLVGADEAPRVAAYYVCSNETYYANALHPVNLLLRDAQKLRTQWATGRHVNRRSNHNGLYEIDPTEGITEDGTITS